jgi:hypothetical protein
MNDSSAMFWLVAFLLLGSYVFIPSAIVTAAIGIWYARTRSKMARYALFPATFALCLSGYGAITYTLPMMIQDRIAQARDAADTHQLTAPTRFRGNILPAGTTLHYEGNDAAYHVELREPATIAGVPVTGLVNVSYDGIEGSVTLARDTTIAGIPCKAPYARFEDGVLQECDLSRTVTIQGVACAGRLLYNRPARTDFSCTLVRPYRTRGITFFPKTKIYFGTMIVGPKAPSLRLLGHPLPPGTSVRVKAPFFEIQFAGTPPISYRGCPLRHVDLERAPFPGYSLQRSGWCRVALPRAALRL